MTMELELTVTLDDDAKGEHCSQFSFSVDYDGDGVESAFLCSAHEGCFYECKSLTSIVIPNKITTIGNGTLFGCTNLKAITIGSSVTRIKSKAFAECKTLERFVCMAENAPSVDSDAFENSYIEYITLFVPDTSVNSYKGAFPWNQFGMIKTISEYNPDEQQSDRFTTQINGIYYILFGKSRTAEVTESPNKYSGNITIPETVEFEGFTYRVIKIGEKAFCYCSQLSSISIPNSITIIGNEAFELCSGLNSVNIPNSVTSIGSSAFMGCSIISSIALPNSIQEIGANAFSGCWKLSSFTIPDDVTVIHAGTFSNCSGLKSVKIPETVTSIENGAFADCI